MQREIKRNNQQLYLESGEMINKTENIGKMVSIDKMR